MSLVDHAKEELARAGFFSKGSDYEGMLGPAVMKMIEVFAAEGHSGMSASITLSLFEKLARFKTLTPITSDPSEWNDVTRYGDPKKPMWQNRRDSRYFSTDSGKTWWSIDDRKEGDPLV